MHRHPPWSGYDGGRGFLGRNYGLTNSSSSIISPGGAKRGDGDFPPLSMTRTESNLAETALRVTNSGIEVGGVLGGPGSLISLSCPT